MATFAYNCPADGPFDLRFPVGAAAPVAACPACGRDAGRVFTSPMIATGDRRRAALIERCERTASTPDVVTAPAARTTRQTGPTASRAGTGGTGGTGGRNPTWARLPRP